MAEGIGGFLSSQTAGLPNWAWIGVVAAGLGAAYLFPKFFGGGATGATTTTDQGAGGIGLAVDPTTGLPYAVEGLVPSGAFAGGGGTGIISQPPSAPPPIVTQPRPPITSTGVPIGDITGGNIRPPNFPQAGQRFVTAQRWPNTLGSLSGIASQSGTSLARIEQLNPQITNPNLIYAGQQIRVA